MSIQEHNENEEIGLSYQGRGKIQVFQILEIIKNKSDDTEGMVVQIFGGDKIFLEASPKFYAFKAKKQFGPAGLLGVSNDDADAWKKDFFHSLLWPSPQQDHDIRINKDWVYAELLDRNKFRETKDHGKLHILEINDLFKVFARDEREKSLRNEEKTIENADQIITGYARIIRDPKKSNAVYTEIVSDPKSFSSYMDMEEYLGQSVGLNNLNGYAVNLRIYRPDFSIHMSANYFPFRMENKKIVAGSSIEEVKEDIATLKDKGIDIKNIYIFETTRAFLDVNAWGKEGKNLQEIKRTMFHVYHQNLQEKPIETEVKEWVSPGGGKPKKKGGNCYMVRVAASRTMFHDKKDIGVPPRPGKIRILTPVGDAELLPNNFVYMIPEQRLLFKETAPEIRRNQKLDQNIEPESPSFDDGDSPEFK